MPKIVLQTLGKPASRLQSLDRELKVPRAFAHFRSDPAHAQAEAQSAKSFLSVWNRPISSYGDSGKTCESFAQNFRALFVRFSACPGGSPKCLKFPGSLEYAQSSSADSGQACESFAIVRSRT